MRLCKIDGCVGKHEGRGLCRKHYQKQWRANHTTICVIEHCEKIAHTNNYCDAHYSKFSRKGNPLYKSSYPEKWSEHPAWKDKPNYNGMHHRIKRMRGRASQYICIDCGQQAEDWSLNKNSEYELTTYRGKILRISYDINDYDPRCKRCHHIYDE